MANATNVQYQVRESAVKIQNEIQDIKKFEEEMKKKEQKIHENIFNHKQESSIPVRSNIDQFQTFSEDSIKKMPFSDGDETAKRKLANKYKEEGSNYFKLKDFEKAIKMYSLAIEVFNEDAVYYSNRSQCYIFLEKFLEAIQDTEMAIKLNNKLPKPYFRRTNAYEKLGDDLKALKSSQEWMEALPNDQLAKNTYDRIHNKLAETKQQKEKEKIKWSRFSVKTNFIEKPSHTKSKKPLETVTIQIKKSISPFPEDVIDKLFNNNTGEHFAEVETDSKLFKSNFLVQPTRPTTTKYLDKPQISILKEKTKINESNEILRANSVHYDICKSESPVPSLEQLELAIKNCKNFSIPTSGPQFYQMWKEFNEHSKFMYLKNISENQNLPLGIMIGAQLDSTLLSEIIQVIHKYFLLFNVPYLQLLRELSKNSELRILSMFIENEDKCKLSELINISSQNITTIDFQDKNEIIQQIKKAFQI